MGKYIRSRYSGAAQIALEGKRESADGLPPGFPDAIAAFNNPAGCFGKLVNRTLKKTGIDDIALKVGCDFVRSCEKNGGLYGVLYIPTASRSKAKHLFEPIIGNGKHVGLGVGATGDYCLSACETSSWTFLADLSYAYFFSGRERRSIDLINGEWSRYLLVSRVADIEAGIVNPLPGINFFTRSVNITPRGMVDLFIAFHYDHCSWNFEAGYDFWWRQKERLCIRPCEQNIAIFDIDGVCPPGRTSASTASITAALPGPGGPISDPVVTPFKNSDFNGRSAAHPAAYSSTIYGAFSYNFDICHPGMIGVGISYEFAHKNSALTQLGVWLKGAVCF